MRNFLLLTAGSVGLTFAGPALAQAIIAPTSGVIDSGGPGFGTLTETFNQAGLSTNYVAGVTNFDSYIAGNPTHTLVFSGFEWFSNQDTTSAQVTYNLGGTFGIDRLALWNEESAGIGTLRLSASLDGVIFSDLGVFSPVNNPRGSDYLAQLFSFTATNAQFVRFTMTDCPQAEAGSYPSCSIGEVAFRTALVGGMVPEPATWALLMLGFGATGAAMRAGKRRGKIAFA